MRQRDNSMANITLVLIIFNLIAVITANNSSLRHGPHKCYTNAGMSKGQADICDNPIPFCCYDLIGEHYCCEEEQWLTIIKNSSIVFGTLFALTLVIVIFCFVFVEFETDSAPPLVVLSTPETTQNIREEEGFSVIFNPKKVKTEEKVGTETKATEEQNKPEEEVKSAEAVKSDAYKPAWGQYDNKAAEKSSSMTRIGFKQKQSKAIQSVEALKQSVTKSKAGEEKSKTNQKKSFNQNVEKISKSLNK